jgi:hypothetical protein
MDYQFIIENGIWLEDKKGRYSRYATEGEESTWVCHHCECVDIDPDEKDCNCYQP